VVQPALTGLIVPLHSVRSLARKSEITTTKFFLGRQISNISDVINSAFITSRVFADYELI
jgi:hypothetical protein